MKTVIAIANEHLGDFIDLGVTEVLVPSVVDGKKVFKLGAMLSSQRKIKQR